MSSPFDISRFPDLPPEVLKAFEAQQAALEASRMEVEASRMEAIIERAARLHQEAIVTEKEGLIATLKECCFSARTEPAGCLISTEN